MELKQLTSQQIADLRKPLPPEAVKQHPTKAYLSTIKVIYIVERLNEIFGVNGWKDTYEFMERTEAKWVKAVKDGKEYDRLVPAMVVVKGVLTIPEYDIRREAFGGNDNEDLGDAYKGACTDALSKIASYLYIGMDVYKGLADKKAPAKAPAAPPKPVDRAPVTNSRDYIKGFVADPKDGKEGIWFKVGTESVFAPFGVERKGLAPGDECELAIERMTNKKRQPYCRLLEVLTIVPKEESVSA